MNARRGEGLSKQASEQSELARRIFFFRSISIDVAATWDIFSRASLSSFPSISRRIKQNKSGKIQFLIGTPKKRKIVFFKDRLKEGGKSENLLLRKRRGEEPGKLLESSRSRWRRRRRRQSQFYCPTI